MVRSILLLVLIFGWARGGIALMNYFMPPGVPYYAEAPTITLSARKDNCVGQEVELWDYPTQKWHCFEPVNTIWADIKNNDSYIRSSSTNIGMFLSATGPGLNSALVVGAGDSIFNDTVTINGRLIVNGVDITPKGKK